MTWQKTKEFFAEYSPHMALTAFIVCVHAFWVIPLGEIAISVIGFMYAYITVPLYSMSLQAMARSKSAIYIVVILAFTGLITNMIAVGYSSQDKGAWLALLGMTISIVFLWFCIGKLEKQTKERESHVPATTS